MLYRFAVDQHTLDRLEPISAETADVLEKHLELAVARNPTALFRTTAAGEPLLVVKQSVPYQKMADIIALDGEGRLILVECKRGWATRDALAQLLDYAADYSDSPFDRLVSDWKSGEGKNDPDSLLDRFRSFADDPTFDANKLGREQVLVVVAAGRDDQFKKVSGYLASRGVPVFFVQLQLFRAATGDLYLDIEPVELAPAGEAQPDEGVRAWFINSDETHSPGAWRRFLDHGVAAVWGYPDGPATLQKGVQPNDTIYAYLNGQGVFARGVVRDPEARQATPETSVFPECTDANEWHLGVDWHRLPTDTQPISNREVRAKAGAGLPIRNTFCRLWNSKVKEALDGRWPGTSAAG